MRPALQDLTLRLLLAQRHELGEPPLPTSRLEAADNAYRRLGGRSDGALPALRKLMEDMPRPCPLALINFLVYAPCLRP